MNDEQLVIEIGAKLTDFQKSMSDATSSASQAMAKIEARGAEAAQKLDAGFANVGKAPAFDTLDKGILTAEKDAGGLVARLKQVNDALNTTKATAANGFATGQGSTLSGLAHQIGNAGSLKAFAASSGGMLGVGALAAGLVAAQTKQLADLQELADKARTTASQMAGLQSVFGKVGIASDTTGKMLTVFADRLLDAKTSGGALADALAAAGISFKQADGSLRPTLDVLADLTRYMRGTSDDATKLKLATAALGDQFAGQFVTSVKAGSSALDNLQSATHRVGAAITNDLAQAAEAGMRSLDRLWDRMNEVYSRAKQVMGFELSSTDQVNAAEARVREAQGAIKQLQMASVLRDVSPAEIAAANKELFDAAQNLALKSPVRVLPGTSPGEVKPLAPNVTPLPTPSDDDPHGHGGRAHKSDDDDDKAADVIAKLRLELQLAQSTGDAHQKISDQLKIEAKLKEAGVEASSAEGKTIADLIRQTDAATEAEKKHKAALDASKKAADAIGESLAQGVESLILDSKRLSDVFASLAKQLEKMALQAVLTGNGPFGGVLSSTTATTGGLFGGLTHLLGFATGGEIDGPGSGTSDSVVARVSKGEFIVNAKAAQSNLGLLHALNGTGPVPRFASGGQVGSTITPSFVGSATGSGHTFNVSAPVTVNASGGTPEQNQDLAAKMQAQMVETMKKHVVGEIAKQMRPGNMLQSVTR